MYKVYIVLLFCQYRTSLLTYYFLYHFQSSYTLFIFITKENNCFLNNKLPNTKIDILFEKYTHFSMVALVISTPTEGGGEISFRFWRLLLSVGYRHSVEVRRFLLLIRIGRLLFGIGSNLLVIGAYPFSIGIFSYAINANNS